MSTVLFLCFLGAVIIAAGMIIYNRKRIRSTRGPMREPALGGDFAARRPVGTSAPNRFDAMDELLDDDDAFADPMVDAKSGNANAKTIEAADEARLKTNEQHSVQFFSNDIISLMVMARPDHPYVGYNYYRHY